MADAKLIAEVVTRKLSALPRVTKQEYFPQRVLLKRTVSFYEENIETAVRLKNQLHKLKRELSLTTETKEKHILTFVIKEKHAELLRLVKRKNELAKQFITLLEGNGKNLTSFPGIGIIAAAQIVAETNGIESFPTIDSFISYAGIAPIERSSGKARRHIQNHKGNRRLNHVLYLVALSQLLRNPKGKAY